MERMDKVDLGDAHFAGLLAILLNAKCYHCGDPITGYPLKADSVYFYQWAFRGEKGETPHVSNLLIFDKHECLIENLRNDSLRAVKNSGQISAEIMGTAVRIMTIGIATADTQFLLLNDINEVMSIGYVTNEGEVIWKFGKPHEQCIPELEKHLRERFCET